MFASYHRKGEALIASCRDGDLPKARKCLEEGADVNYFEQRGRGLGGRVPLQLVTYYGYIQLVILLLESGADPSGRGATSTRPAVAVNRTPILTAAFNGRLDILQLLIAHGVDVNIISVNGATALYYATKRWHTECVRLLCAKGADPNVGPANSPLTMACYMGYADIALLLLEAGADPNVHQTIQCAGPFGNEVTSSSLPLNVAAGRAEGTGQSNCVKILLRGPDRKAWYTFLAVLSRREYILPQDVLRYIFGFIKIKRADPSKKDKEGQTALEVAREARGTPTEIKNLLKK